MSQEAELKVNSGSVKQLTVAVESLVTTLEKLVGSTNRAEKSTKKAGDSAKRTSKDTEKLKGAQDKAAKSADKLAASQGKSAREMKKAGDAAKKAAKKGFKEGGKETKNLQERLQEMANSAQLVDGPLGGVASRISVIGRVAKSGNIAIVGFSVATVLLVKTLISMSQSADRANIILGTLEAQVKATGEAAGFSAKELDTFSRNLAFATLDSHEGVTKLVKAMGVFRNVTRNTFTTAIKLSQDLGVAMSQDPVTAAKTLGKALDNPARSYKSLERAVGKFTDAEIEAIRVAGVNNNLLAQQQVILDKVKGSVEGLAKAQADSLEGDIDTFNQKWDLLAETIGSKLLDGVRETTQASNSLLDVFQEIVETRPETLYRELSEKTDTAGSSLDELRSKQTSFREELEETRKGIRDLVKRKEKISIFNPAEAILVNKEIDKLRDKYESILSISVDITSAIKGFSKTEKLEAQLPKGTKESIKALNERVKIQEKLNNIFKETEDSRSVAFRHEQVRAKIEAKSVKDGLIISSESFREKVKLGKDNLTIQEKAHKQLLELAIAESDLTEERIRYNTAFQITRGLENKSRGLQLQIDLQNLLAEGLTKSSEKYIRQKAAIEGKNKALAAGFEVGDEEYNIIVKQTNALADQQIELQKILNLKEFGLTLSGNSVIAIDTIIGAEVEMNRELRLLRELNLEDIELFEEKELEIRRKYAEQKSSLTGLNFFVDEEGNEELLSNMEANFAERDEKLKSLEREARSVGLLGHEEYLRKRNEITEAYDQKAAEIAQKNFEATNAHKQRLRQADIASGVAAGLENLSAVAGHNKKMAKMAKVAAMFSASTSLVDALANAAALPFPSNIAAYVKAGVQGTELIQMASQLNEPSFAFGGINIQGRGTGRSDDINARISSGESVMTQAATSRYSALLERMNAGLSIPQGGGGNSIAYSPQIVIQGDASSKTLDAIDERLGIYESRVYEIARGASTEVINEEQEVGGVFDPI